MLEHSSASGSWTQRQFAFGFSESTLKGPDDIFSTDEIFYICILLFSVNPASLKICLSRNLANSVTELLIIYPNSFICLCLSGELFFNNFIEYAKWMCQICVCSFRVRRENNFYHTVLSQLLSLNFFH